MQTQVVPVSMPGDFAVTTIIAAIPNDVSTPASAEPGSAGFSPPCGSGGFAAALATAQGQSSPAQSAQPSTTPNSAGMKLPSRSASQAALLPDGQAGGLPPKKNFASAIDPLLSQNAPAIVVPVPLLLPAELAPAFPAEPTLGTSQAIKATGSAVTRSGLPAISGEATPPQSPPGAQQLSFAELSGAQGSNVVGDTGNAPSMAPQPQPAPVEVSTGGLRETAEVAPQLLTLSNIAAAATSTGNPAAPSAVPVARATGRNSSPAIKAQAIPFALPQSAVPSGASISNAAVIQGSWTATDLAITDPEITDPAITDVSPSVNPGLFATAPTIPQQMAAPSGLPLRSTDITKSDSFRSGSPIANTLNRVSSEAVTPSPVPPTSCSTTPASAPSPGTVAALSPGICSSVPTGLNVLGEMAETSASQVALPVGPSAASSEASEEKTANAPSPAQSTNASRRVVPPEEKLPSVAASGITSQPSPMAYVVPAVAFAVESEFGALPKTLPPNPTAVSTANPSIIGHAASTGSQQKSTFPAATSSNQPGNRQAPATSSANSSSPNPAPATPTAAQSSNANATSDKQESGAAQAATAEGHAAAIAPAPASLPVAGVTASPDSASSTKPDSSAAPGSGPPAPAPVVETPTVPAPGPVQAAQILSRAGQSEMRIGMNTSAFGSVEVRTTVHAGDVGLVIGSEKGDLHALLANDIPVLASALQQQNLRLNSVNFHQGFAFSNNMSGGGDAQQRYYAPPRALPRFTAPEAIAESSNETVPAVAAAVSGGISILA